MKVMRDWTEEIPRRMQGALVVALRGCDVVPKRPGELPPERELVAYLRWLVMNPADDREVDQPGAFMRSTPPSHWRASEFGHYPQHWYAHLMHAFQVIAIRHPEEIHRQIGAAIYGKFVDNLHLRMEFDADFERRMVEDRIAAGTVVS